MASSSRYTKTQEEEPFIESVQIEGLALMKITKHCHEECIGNLEVAQGALLGLIVGKTLEITNCFAFPKNYDDSIDEEDYQLDMMRRLRRVNVDHYHVGWYQSSDVGNFLSLPLLESQYHYQTSIEESVVLIYDTNRTSRGFLTVKAYRLTPQAIKLFKENDFSPETLRSLKISYETLLMEVPIVIKNSTLTNILLSELTDYVPPQEGSTFLDLGTASVLEGQLRSLMERVDDLNQEAIKFNRYQLSVARQAQDKNRYLLKRAQENALRATKKEPPLPEEDVNKLFKPILVPSRITPMLMASQVEAYGEHISKFCSQSLAKLFIMQSTKNN